MSFREMVLKRPGLLPAVSEQAIENSLAKTLLQNQSPVMFVWFAIMGLNLAVLVLNF